GTIAAGPCPDEIGTDRDDALHEERPPVVTDEVDGRAYARDFADEPVDVRLLRRDEARWPRRVEAGQGDRDHVAAREVGAHPVPEPVRVGDPVDEDGWHGGFSIGPDRPLLRGRADELTRRRE